MKLLSKLIEIIKNTIKVNLAYRSSILIGIVSSIIQIFLSYYIWLAVFKDKSVMNGMNKAQIITYVVLARIIAMQFTIRIDQTIGRMIYQGNIAIEMLRPIDFQMAMYFRAMGEFVYFIVFKGIPILVVSMFIISILSPAGIIYSLAFFLSLVFGMTISFMIEFSLGLLSFYTLNMFGIYFMKIAILSFLSGVLIPLQFFPVWLRSIVNFLPFKDMVYTPIAIYLGLIPNGIVRPLFFQILWIIVLFFVTRLFYLFSIKKVIVQGG